MSNKYLHFDLYKYKYLKYKNKYCNNKEKQQKIVHELYSSIISNWY